MTTELENTELEALVARMIDEVPDGFLSAIEKTEGVFGIAIRAPKGGIDRPVKILVGSYVEVRAFENAYGRIKAACSAISEMAIDSYAGETLPGEIAYWNQKAAQEA